MDDLAALPHSPCCTTFRRRRCRIGSSARHSASFVRAGVFVATDSLDSADLRAFHHDDTYVPISPDDLPARLGAAGFEDIDVEQNDYAWKALSRCTSTT